MTKALKMGKDSAVGSFQLFAGRVTSSIILAVGVMILGRLISPEDYGLYTVALIPPLTFLLFQDWGIHSAITKYCANFRSTGHEGDIRKIISTGFTFSLGTGFALTLISMLFSSFIAVSIYGRPEAVFLMQLASIVILLMSIYTVSQSIFVGFEKMRFSVYTILSQAITQSVLSAVLVYFGFGAMGVLIGYVASYLIASIVAVFLLYFGIFNKLSKGNGGRSNEPKSDMRIILKPLLMYGVPLALSSLANGLLTQLYSSIMAFNVTDTLIANYRMALNFSVLLTFFTMPISTVLFPAFSKVNPGSEKGLIKTVFTSSVKYASLLLVPATIFVIMLSGPIVSVLYGNKWVFTPTYLALYSISQFTVIFGSISMKSLFTGVGETKLLMKLDILSLCIGVPLAFFVVPLYGIVGLIVVNIFAEIPEVSIGLYFAWKRYGVKADFGSSSRIFLAATIAAVVTFPFLFCFSLVDWLQLTISTLVFVATFLIGAPLVGAVNQTDVANLRSMFSGLGVISTLLEIPLSLMEKTLKIRLQRGETEGR